MRHNGWAYGCGLLLLLAALLLASGCAKPTFSVVEKRVCAGVDGAGNPQQEKTTFAPADGRVCLWFRYRNAAAGQVIKAKFTHVDEVGNESAQDFEIKLNAGSHTGVAELTGENGGPLTPGRYTAEIQNQSGVAYGPALAFNVQ